MTLTNTNIYTVSRLNAEVRLLLENEMGIVWLVGEISNLTMATSGHWYFTLKDRQAQVKCAMFKGNNRRVTFRPANGNQVLVRARLSLYEPRGDYQIIVESMQPEGDGLLQQQFEKLKMQLAAEGLFAASLKKPLPEQPRRVGVVTSSTGAALHDILHVLKRRDPSLPVVIYPTQVQGKDAAIQIAQAIGRANSRNECDVLIVGRGGGSLEDLWCFNEEIVARTIAASTIPIVSAVGHEIDVTIADFVADVRAPTPSAAAELVSRDTSVRVQQLSQRTDRLAHAFSRHLSRSQEQLTRLQHRLALQHPKARIQHQAQQLDELKRRLHQSMRYRLQTDAQRLDRALEKLERYSPANQIPGQKALLGYMEQRLIDAMRRQLRQHQHALALKMETLDAVSPLATLARGYSITRNERGEVIRSVSMLKSGDQIISSFGDGEIQSTVN
ncbi:exodeoxyribonuclease VII large subunit [Grimontia hollisae]|uniref:Exodeoxyribonuclease 7 large subunit n=1 Tax=Grimontia hollisae CIP 101886 TaxID=675812 RepID=D0ICK6_GRIHO|nr:exodeoxyribonuclease VII large subunit [Grimontia hollisae]AMG29992.1 exodeoxyribonuclease VII large subunit [Grimontia hollisae]EEY71624.1 exodeoxyribonuclease VII large subunit [Grimontia hollisae CIP 101886]STO42901.1 Exodeoxyribonuclease 7 large subunit [Grimontia hollisae]